MKKVITRDGSVTFYDESVGDHYHTKSGAKEEAFEKHANALAVSSGSVVFDICFGLGYNAAAAIDIADSLIIYCFENDRKILEKVIEIDASFKSYGMIKNFVKGFLEEGKTEYLRDGVKLIMVFGDAREEILKVDEKADFVFFDPFSPAKVPDMWTSEFLSIVNKKMRENGKLSTYSYSRKVRDNLASAGFEVIDGPVIGRRSPSTIAIKK